MSEGVRGGERSGPWRTLVTAGATLGVLGFVVWKVEPGPIVDAIRGADFLLVLAGALVAILFHTVQSAELLRCMLKGFAHELAFRHALAATGGNMAIKAALPAGTGELVRIVYLSRVCGAPAAHSTAAVLSILWCKLFWLQAIALAGWIARPGRDSLLGAALAAGILVCTGLPAWAILRGRTLSRGRERSGAWGRLMAAIARAAADARPGWLAIGILHCLLSVVAEIGVFVLVLAAAGGPVDALAIAALLPIAIIGAKVPLTILGVGTREVLVVMLLASTAPDHVLAGAAMLFSAVEYVVPALVGAALTWGFVSRLTGSGPRAR